MKDHERQKQFAPYFVDDSFVIPNDILAMSREERQRKIKEYETEAKREREAKQDVA